MRQTLPELLTASAAGAINHDDDGDPDTTE
jgi:hypothetical protein